MLSRYVSPAGRRALFDDEDGLSLIEVLIAMVVLSVAVLALASTAAAAVTSLRISRDRQNATAAASAAIETVRSYDWEGIAHPANEVTPTTDPDYVTGGASPYEFAHDGQNAEELVVSVMGEVSPHIEVQDRFTVRTFVTWYDDPSTASTRDARRVTAIVTWSDPSGADREVRQSTIVAEAERGLPVPKFDISPDDLLRYFDETPLCFTYVLRNIGATDRYDWALLNNGGNVANLQNDYTWRAHGWEAHAWWGTPQYVGGEPDTSADNLWKKGADQQRPTSPSAVNSGETDVLTICFVPKNSTATGHSSPDMRVVTRSVFDTTVDRTVWTRIRKTTAPPHTLYLLPPDREDDGTYSRVTGVPYDMSTTLPLEFDGDGNIIDVLSDYDPNLDPDVLGGIWLPRAESGAADGSEHTGIWTYNGFNPGTTIRESKITLYTSWEGAFSGSSSTPTLEFRFALDVIDGGTGDVLQSATVDPDSITYTHTDAGWMEISAESSLFDLLLNPTTLEFPTGDEHLRLRVWCGNTALSGGSNPDCHLAFATPSYQSHLVVFE